MWQRTASSKKKMTREECQWRSGDGCIWDLIETSIADIPVAVKEAEGETAIFRVFMPESWLHTYSLAFACFGRFPDHPDPDINLFMSDDPLEATSEGTLDQSQSSNRIGGSWKKTLRGRIYADETLSRAAHKRQKSRPKMQGCQRAWPKRLEKMRRIQARGTKSRRFWV